MSAATRRELSSPAHLTVVGAARAHTSLGLSEQVRAASPARPRAGWRGLLHRVSRGVVNPGVAGAERERNDRLGRIVAQLGGWHVVTVVSSKGGVGRSTVVAGLGLVLAQTRGDRVIAVDAHPEYGTLNDRLLAPEPETETGAGDLSAHPGRIHALTDRVGNLTVLGSAARRGPARLGGADYDRLVATLSASYNIILTDTSALLGHPATLAAVRHADTVVVVATAGIDGAAAASRTLDWVRQQHPTLAGDAIVVLMGHQHHPRVDRRALRGYFAARCRVVVEIPDDPHLAGGGPLDLARLQPRTRAALLDVAANVADQFQWGAPAHSAAPTPTGPPT